MSQEHRCELDVAAYALGALDPEERRTVAEHLERCVVCRDELAAFEQVVDLLALGPAQVSPPPRLRRRVLAEVRRLARSGEREARHPSSRAARRPGWLGAPLVRPLAGLATVAALAAGVLLTGGLPRSSGASRVYHASVGDALVRVSDGHAELVVSDLPQPRPGHIYEVWVVRHDGVTPQPTSALFDVRTAGNGDVGVPGSIAGVRRIVVTEEPAGGSQRPTSPPVIVAPLTRT